MSATFAQAKRCRSLLCIPVEEAHVHPRCCLCFCQTPLSVLARWCCCAAEFKTTTSAMGCLPQIAFRLRMNMRRLIGKRVEISFGLMHLVRMSTSRPLFWCPQQALHIKRSMMLTLNRLNLESRTLLTIRLAASSENHGAIDGIAQKRIPGRMSWRLSANSWAGMLQHLISI